MKHLLLLLFLAAFSAASYAQKNDSFSIVGQWQIQGDEDEGSMSLDSLGFFYFITEEMTMGGDSFMIDGSLAKISYQVVDSTSPKQIIVTLINWDENETKIMRGIFNVIDQNTIKMYLNTEDETQPTKFDEDDSPIFKRITN